MAIEVETEEQFLEVLDEAGDKLVVVDFWATWCGPCKMIGPHFQNLADEPAYSNVIFLTIDVDELGDLAESWGIACMPTFLFIRNSKKVDEMSGANRDMLRQQIDNNNK